LPEQVEGSIKKARSREMHALAAEMKQCELARHLGTRAEVLWEQQINSDLGQWTGYSPHYHKITSMHPEIDAASITEVSIDAVSADGSMLVNEVNRPQVTLAEIGQYDARG
jgi:threonylcarbamoyladenosine tRNA methylthiotransferase MtaB